MEIWSKCDICGRDIPVGELCYGLKKGNCICKDCCTGFENCTFTLAPAPTLTPPNEPLTLISMSDEIPPDNERVLVYRPCMVDSDTRPYSVQWGWAAKRDGSHWARLPDRRPTAEQMEMLDEYR